MKTAQMKIARAVVGLLLVAGGAAACGDNSSDSGGGSSVPDKANGASTEEFCAAFKGFADDVSGLTGKETNLGEILKKAVKQIEDVGTPSDMPADAKEGLQLTLDAIDSLPDDATDADMQAIEDGFSDADKKKADAFSAYLDKTCPDLGGGAESPSSSESASVPAPSESPSGGS